jgi:hypothetical protein
MMNMQRGQTFAAQCGERMQEHDGIDPAREAHYQTFASLYPSLQAGCKYPGQPRSQPWRGHINAR